MFQAMGGGGGRGVGHHLPGLITRFACLIVSIALKEARIQEDAQTMIACLRLQNHR
jgi:hypothetical protein